MKRIALIIFVVVLLLAASLAAVGCSMLYTYPNSDRYSIGGSSIDAASVGNLDLNWVSGNVQIRQGSGSSIVFYEQCKKELKDKDKMCYWLDGNTLNIKFRASGFLAFNSLSKEKILVVEIPANTDFSDVNITTISAACSINTSLTCDGLTVKSVSGDITLNNADVALLKIDSVSGTINAEDSCCNTVDVKTVSGDINLFLKNCPVSFKYDSVSGTAALYIPDNAGFSVAFKTISGVFNSNFATQIQNGNYIYGSGLYSFSIKTVSGDFTVTKI